MKQEYCMFIRYSSFLAGLKSTVQVVNAKKKFDGGVLYKLQVECGSVPFYCRPPHPN
jgi:hypothetical protein